MKRLFLFYLYWYILTLYGDFVHNTFASVKTKKVIGLAALGYLLYDKMKQSSVLKQLQDTVSENADTYNAQFNQLSNDFQNAIAENKGYITEKNTTASVRIELSSIDDKYWCMAGWVTFKNESSEKKLLSGVLVSWSYNGHVCSWQLWENGSYSIPAHSSVTIRLHSVNTKEIFPARNSREIIKNALRSATGTRKSLVASVGNSIPITANVKTLQTIPGYSTPHIFVLEDVSGSCKYASYGVCFRYASKINGSSIKEFQA